VPSHEIEIITDNPEASARLRANGYEVCGRCHEEYWDNYFDYYHGAAYQAGATDAPACWDCHGYHLILPSDDRRSQVHDSNLLETCSKCHDGVNEEYVAYAGFVHRRPEVYSENWLYSRIQSARDSIQGFLGQVRSWFT
jgi:nitrate/TMAO reductase-like tetraheme cytochrome c subunit